LLIFFKGSKYKSQTLKLKLVPIEILNPHSPFHSIVLHNPLVSSWEFITIPFHYTMMIPVTSDFDHHNRRSKERYFKIISINGNKPACAGDGVPDTASVKIGYMKTGPPKF